MFFLLFYPYNCGSKHNLFKSACGSVVKGLKKIKFNVN